jgi:UDP-glucose 4-epimerase
MIKILVTGHRGYIGSVLCKMLKEQGYYVIGIDNDDSKQSKYADEDHSCSFSQLVPFDVSGVFHLAANSLLGPSAYDPMVYFINNVGNTSKMLARLNECHKMPKVVYASSAAVYAHNYDKTPISEDFHKDSPNNYGLSKWMSEQVIEAYCNVFNTPITCFRFFNVAGSYGDVGIQDNTPHLISRLIQAQMDKVNFKIYGQLYDTPDGTCVRDYVHVVDICRAMIHAYETIDNPGYRAYNLGLGIGTSVLEMVEKYYHVTGHRQYDFVDKRQGDPAYLVADPSKFKEDTGFVYQHHLIEDMINDAIEARKLNV